MTNMTNTRTSWNLLLDELELTGTIAPPKVEIVEFNNFADVEVVNEDDEDKPGKYWDSDTFICGCCKCCGCDC